MAILKPTRRNVVNPRPPKKTIGLGDVVASVAQPIAKAIDAVAGTNVSNCGECKSEQARLNKAVPDIFHPFK